MTFLFVCKSINMLFLSIFFTIFIIKLILKIHSKVISKVYKLISFLIGLTYPFITIYFIYLYMNKNNLNIEIYLNNFHIVIYIWTILKNFLITKILFYFIYETKYIKKLLIDSKYINDIEQLNSLKNELSEFYKKLFLITNSKNEESLTSLNNFHELIKETICIIEAQINDIYKICNKVLKINLKNLLNDDLSKYKDINEQFYKLSNSLYKKNIYLNKLFLIYKKHIDEEEPFEYTSDELNEFLMKLKEE